MSNDDDDKPTVVLDLNALKKQKLEQEEELANIETELEFNVNQAPAPKPAARPMRPAAPVKEPVSIEMNVDGEEFAEEFLENRSKNTSSGIKNISPEKKNLTVILFDFQSEFFQSSQSQFPKNYDYVVAKTLPELNKHLGNKKLQIVIFNYDVNPKAVNQLTAQIKQKFSHIRTIIMAKAISPEKAKLHAKTPSGANGYCQFPIDAKKIEAEFVRIEQADKKVS